MVRLVRACGCAETDRKSVPGVDRDYCQCQVYQFPFRKMLFYQIVDFIRQLVFADFCNGFCPGEGNPLTLAIERRLSPCTDSKKALFTFSPAASVFGVHIDAVG